MHVCMGEAHQVQDVLLNSKSGWCQRGPESAGYENYQGVEALRKVSGNKVEPQEQC